MPGAAMHVPIQMAHEKKKKKKDKDAEARRVEAWREEQREQRTQGAITGAFVGDYRPPSNLRKVVPEDDSFKDLPAKTKQSSSRAGCNQCFQTVAKDHRQPETIEAFLRLAVEKEAGQQHSSLPEQGTGFFSSPVAFLNKVQEFSLECQTLVKDWSDIVEHAGQLADDALETEERKKRAKPLTPKSADPDEVAEFGFSGGLPYHFEHIALTRDIRENNLNRKQLEAPYKNNVQLYIKTLRSVYKEKRAKGEDFTQVSLPSAKLFADDGLFQGETLVHIFVCKQNDVMSQKNLEFLLAECKEDGVPPVLTARATGLFFQQPFVLRPHWRRPFLRPLLNFFGIEPWFANPYSACYFGELPFSFASSVGNVDAMEMMYMKGCRTAQKDNETEGEWIFRRASVVLDFMQQHDCHGNTALHMAVKYKQLKVVEWFIKKCKWLKNWDCFKRLNFDQLTPLTLAVQLGHIDLFQYMVDRIHRKVMWQFGRCIHTEVELDQIDSWQETVPVGLVPQGSELKSVWLFPRQVEQIVQRQNESFADTMWTPQIYSRVLRECELEAKLGSKTAKKWRDPKPLGAIEVAVKHEVKGASTNQLMVDVIQDKWTSHVRATYLCLAIIPYIVFLTCATLYSINRFRIHREALALGVPESSVTTLGGPAEWIYEIVFLSVYTMLLLGRAAVHLRVDWTDLDVNGDRKIEWDELESFLFKNMVSAMSLGIVVLMWIAWALRAGGEADWEVNILAVLGVLAWVHGVTYLLPFRFFGVLILSVHRMIVVDLLKFLVIYGFALLGFSLGIHGLLMNADRAQLDQVLDEDCPSCDSSWWAMIRRYLWASLGEIDLSNLMEQSRNSWLALTLHVIFVIISTVLLLNLLIALLSRTFVETDESGKERWWQEFAGTVLRHEDVWTKCAIPLVERFSLHNAAILSESLRSGKMAKGKCLKHKYRMPCYFPTTRSHLGEEAEKMELEEDTKSGFVSAS